MNKINEVISLSSQPITQSAPAGGNFILSAKAYDKISLNPTATEILQKVNNDTPGNQDNFYQFNPKLGNAIKNIIGPGITIREHMKKIFARLKKELEERGLKDNPHYSECLKEAEKNIKYMHIGHNCSLEKAVLIWKEGRMLTAREIEKITEKGHDKDSHSTKTFDEDRKYGLDQYTFGLLGKNGDAYGPIGLVLKKDLLKKPGAFVTIHDFLQDCIHGDISSYQKEMVGGEDALELLKYYLASNYETPADYLKINFDLDLTRGQKIKFTDFNSSYREHYNAGIEVKIPGEEGNPSVTKNDIIGFIVKEKSHKETLMKAGVPENMIYMIQNPNGTVEEYSLAHHELVKQYYEKRENNNAKQ